MIKASIFWSCEIV